MIVVVNLFKLWSVISKIFEISGRDVCQNIVKISILFLVNEDRSLTDLIQTATLADLVVNLHVEHVYLETVDKIYVGDGLTVVDVEGYLLQILFGSIIVGRKIS